MEIVEISKLKPHPRNNEFFDDIQGDNWIEFKKSIETSGVIEPIVISNTSIIVSGHQRVKACRELNIKEIPCRIKLYDTDDAEDQILKELLETNLRQRGVGNTNPIKLGRCIRELERLYGIRDGSGNTKGDNRIGERNNFNDQKSQSDLAEELGIDQRQLLNYKKLLSLIPELQTLIETGQMNSTVGYKVWAKIPEEEQKRLVAELGKDKISEMTQKQTQEYINKLQEERDKTQRLQNDINGMKSDKDRLHELNSTQQKEVIALRNELNAIKEASPEQQYTKKLRESAIFFRARIDTFLKEVGGYSWVASDIRQLPESEMDSFVNAISVVRQWVDAMDEGIRNVVYSDFENFG